MGKDQKPTPDIVPETDFWQKLVSSGMTDFEVRTLGEQDQQGLYVVSLAVSMKTKTADGSRSRYVMEQQAWQQQGDQWRIVVAAHCHNLNSIAGWRRETQARVGNQFRPQVDDDILIAVFKRFHKAGLLWLTKPKWLGVTIEYSGKEADDAYFFLTTTFRAEFTPTGINY